MSIPRLDILLYSHDGRGLGHASRTIAIGMALRRLYPRLRVLFVSGTPMSRELRGAAPLDWLKLPAYETRVVEGRSRGMDGMSNYTDQQLGLLRAASLRQIMELYRPRVVLADHSPCGKHRELLPALESCSPGATSWVLGVRGVVGKVRQVGSAAAAEVFRRHFKALLWYGDSTILGSADCSRLADTYGTTPLETGYVSRMAELAAVEPFAESGPQPLATISIPWFGENSTSMLSCLYQALQAPELVNRRWNIFLPAEKGIAKTARFVNKLKSIPGCRLFSFGPRYHGSLLASRAALIYGGYNSLTDVLYARVPTIVLERAMEDDEQQQHLALLTAGSHGLLRSVAEQDLEPEHLRRLLATLFRQPRPPAGRLNLEGAAMAAAQLAALV
ncbi:hypothetical protein [Desulfogranum mediterraneum]|uniref:hypothetical protein n=1 Tax=Desulfogranum mediterraneum TaxID=160661 RepID=UPI0004905EF4|nr:hypothetical protein [Desulfogranum mediterraneum]